MTEKAVILLSRKRAGASELLFVRPRGALYYQFPVAVQTGKETIKSSIRITLTDLLQVKAQEIQKASATGYQSPAGAYVLLALYTVRTNDDPQLTEQIDEVVWLSKNEALKRTAQMTNMMQDYIFPCLEENELWQ